jgi:hypothetical protein
VRSAAIEAVTFPVGRSGMSLGNWYCDRSGTRCYYPGHHQGFHAFAYWDSRRRLAVAFVSNGTLTPRLQVEVPRLLIAAAEGRQPPPSCERSQTRPLEPIAGSYQFPGLGRATLSRRSDALFLRAPSGVDYRVYPAGDGTYYAPGLDAYVRRAGDDLTWSSVFTCARGRRDG